MYHDISRCHSYRSVIIMVDVLFINLVDLYSILYRYLVCARVLSQYIDFWHRHSITTLISKLPVCMWMPTAHRSAFAVATFSDLHRCLDCLQLALLAVNKKSPGCKLPHDWLVMLSIDLATFSGI